jgi:hypothetical protein
MQLIGTRFNVTWKIALAAVALSLFVEPIEASNWAKVADSDDGSTSYVDLDSLDGAACCSVIAWVKYEFTNNREGFKDAKLREEFLCRTAERRVLQFLIRFEDGTTKSLSGPTSWTYVAPDTTTDAIYKLVCGK